MLPVHARRRVGCDGVLAPPYDSCTFNGPVGRLIKGYEQYLDIWDLEVRLCMIVGQGQRREVFQM